MKSQSLKRSTLLSAFLFASGVAWAGESQTSSSPPRSSATAACTDVAASLAAVAQEQGFPINAAQAMTMTTDGLVFSAATFEGLEQTPPTQYAEGVDVAFVYMDVPDSDIPAGYYRLKATAKAEDIQVGTYAGSVGFFDLTGKEVVRVDASFETSALSDPTPGPFTPARVTIRGGFGPHPKDYLRLMRNPIAVIYTGYGVLVVYAYHPHIIMP
ncbi:hypothetical protein D7Y27_32445 [Corallococcus sp. AB004]|uniref:hypothetical protein n=1 Tax=Corallococcus exiguus TaxID=83462 RepID=UPI000EA1FF5A|nr:hypothetical protein [Corallococcus exiguus]NRD49220.1 hypothetical protein [Corallococcus exiguus]RKI35231.1 hypothetical protein D7Y27_32445 [Corallococcus sp. AB004]